MREVVQFLGVQQEMTIVLQLLFFIGLEVRLINFLQLKVNEILPLQAFLLRLAQAPQFLFEIMILLIRLPQDGAVIGEFAKGVEQG